MTYGQTVAHEIATRAKASQDDKIRQQILSNTGTQAQQQGQ